MKKLGSIIFFLSFFISFAQSKITVYAAGERTPVSNATISCNKKIIGKTASNGILQFKTKCKSVDVKAPGFYEDEVLVDQVMEITLSKLDPKVQSIEEVIIADKSDPRALKILQKVNDEYQNNSPQSLDSYSFKSYEKFSLDLDEDSIKNYNQFVDHRIDSLKTLPNADLSAKKKKDSLENINMLKLLGTNKLFLWERASEFLFSKKYGEKINILDNRVSGLQQPLYEMMSLRSNRNRIPREIREENRSLYRFFLTDSIQIEGRKNYVIRFRQTDYKKPINRRKFNGYIYVDAETFGLKKIESNSKKKSEGSITSIWKPIENKWFLNKENFKFRMGSTTFGKKEEDKKEENSEKKEEKDQRKKFGNYVYMMADYFDYKTPIEVEKKDFSGYTMDVKNSDGSILNQFRTDSLTAREKLTYIKIDSVGKKYKLDQKINIVAGLLKGNLRFGMVDFAVDEIIKYNKYEGIRL